MDKQKLALLAKEEYANPENAIHRGGKNGNAFWNIRATRFMFCPSFDFTPILACNDYLYVAVDENGKNYEFRANTTTELLTPIWDELPVGQTQLFVYALDKNGEKIATVGARSFYKAAPFTADYPAAACDYRICAKRAYEYAFSLPLIQAWKEKDADLSGYYLYMYISKMNSAIINGMLNYAKLSPENKDAAINIAVNAADYLIKVSAPEGSALEGLPPTYHYPEGREDYFATVNDVAKTRVKENMLIYPANVGAAYLNLYAAVGDKKYFDAALKIGKYYLENVCENGTWWQLVSTETGKPTSPAYCMPHYICTFLYNVYSATGEEKWKTLADNAMNYLRDCCLKSFHWQGQFEDSPLSVQYSNMTHFPADALICDIAQNHSDSETEIAIAEELMRYVEDQFVIWSNPMKYTTQSIDTSIWHTPCGLEQYEFYVPIDSSTAGIMNAFKEMHALTKKPLYLEKAKTLADSITRVQNAENGQISTHWFTEGYKIKDDNLWINCMFATANHLFDLADYLDKQ